jgi:hypothetical protein
MGLGRFQPLASGDCCDCVKFQDNFNRANSDSLGVKWSEEDGVWSILSNKLQETTGTGMVVTTTAFNLPQFVYATLINVQVGNRYQVVVRWIDAESHYYAEAYWSGPNTVELSLHRREPVGGPGTPGAGVDTLLESHTWNAAGFVTGTDWPIKVCIEDSHFHVRLGAVTTKGDAWVAVSLSEVRLTSIGLANSSPGTITFDDVRMETRNCTAYCFSTCPDCFLRCDQKHLPFTVTVTVVGSGRCNGFTDSFMMAWDYDQRKWTHATPFNLCEMTGLTNAYYIQGTEETCLGGKSTFQFGRAGDGSLPYVQQDDSTCSPLNLHYAKAVTPAETPAVCCPDPPDPYGPAGQLDFYVTE